MEPKRVLKLGGTLAVLAWLGWVLTGCVGISLGVAAFTATPTAGVAALSVQFTNQSTGTPTKFEWDFDSDGVIDSNIPNPTYTYTIPGVYTVSLTVTYGGLGTSTETKEDYIKVGNKGVGVPGATHTTLAAAVAAANPGDIIVVGAGTYTGDVTVTANGVTIMAASRPVLDGDLIVDADSVTIDGLEITGRLETTTGFQNLTLTDCLIWGVVVNINIDKADAVVNPATAKHPATENIQDAIDAANPGDTIWVAPGIYREYLHITTDNLTVQGAGIDQSIIDLDGLMPYWHYEGCSTSYASRAGVLISGYGSPDEIVEGVTFKGFTVKNAGLNPPGGGSYPEFLDPEGDGQDDVRGIGIGNGKNILIQNCKVVNSGYYGITVGKARCTSLKQSEGVTIDSCISSNNHNSGINVADYTGPITITNNICSNNKMDWSWKDPTRQYAGCGIYVKGSKSSKTVSGVISGNTCSDNGFQGIVLHNYIDGVVVENNIVTGHNLDEDGAGIFFYAWGHPERCKNVTIRNNTVTGNIRGIVAYYASNSTIEDNTITTDSGTWYPDQGAIKIDGSNNITVRNNTIGTSNLDGTGISVVHWEGVSGSYNNTITGNTITSAKFAGIFISGDAHDNTFTNNTITGTTILTRWTGQPYEETQGDGVFIDDDAGTGNVFHYNNIYGNTDDGMENQIATMIDAENNWWGCAAGPSNPGCDTVVGNVDFTPWLTSPVP